MCISLSKSLKRDLRSRQQSGEGNGDGGDKYAGLDRFGRIVDQRWIKNGGTSLDRFQYAYDRDSNVTSKINTNATNFNETYTYNGMSQLIAVDRSNGTADDQSWSLDALGNMTSVTTGSTTQNRTHNSDNQITIINSNTGMTYDAAGNITTDDQGHTLIYDAWNRLVAVEAGGALLKAYTYDGLGRIATETDGYNVKDLYYNKKWQLIEEKTGSTVNANYLWSPVYVDALMYRSSAGDGNYYATYDGNFNVTSIYPSSSTPAERFVYSAYGTRTTLSANFTASADSKAMSIGWQGLRADSATGYVMGRNRWYSPTLMRWMSADPAGYIDGASLYQPLLNNPNRFRDPWGLSAGRSLANDAGKPTDRFIPDEFTGGLFGTPPRRDDGGFNRAMGRLRNPSDFSGVDDPSFLVDDVWGFLKNWPLALGITFEDGEAYDSMRGFSDGISSFRENGDDGPLYGNVNAYNNGKRIAYGAIVIDTIIAILYGYFGAVDDIGEVGAADASAAADEAALDSGAAENAAINPDVINEIKALPNDAQLTPTQVSELGKNIDAVLNKSLPAKAASGNVQNVVDLFNNDPRFRFINQVPGAIEKINQALGQYGASLTK